MSASAPQVTSPTIVNPRCIVYSRRISKKTSTLPVTGLCEGNSPLTGEFPAQRASYAANVSIWWRHHGYVCPQRKKLCNLECFVYLNCDSCRSLSCLIQERWYCRCIFYEWEITLCLELRLCLGWFNSSPPGQNRSQCGRRQFQVYFTEWKWQNCVSNSA